MFVCSSVCVCVCTSKCVCACVYVCMFSRALSFVFLFEDYRFRAWCIWDMTHSCGTWLIHVGHDSFIFEWFWYIVSQRHTQSRHLHIYTRPTHVHITYTSTYHPPTYTTSTHIRTTHTHTHHPPIHMPPTHAHTTYKPTRHILTYTPYSNIHHTRTHHTHTYTTHTHIQMCKQTWLTHMCKCLADM